MQFGPGAPVVFLYAHLSVILTSPWKKIIRTYRTNPLCLMPPHIEAYQKNTPKRFYIPIYSKPRSVKAVFSPFDGQEGTLFSILKDLG